MSKPAYLRTARLLLRRAAASDLDAIHEIMSDARAMKYWSSLPHAQKSETQQWLNNMLDADQAGDSDEFIIELKGALIGKIGAWRSSEIGFFLRPDHWGGGYATEALKAYIEYATSRRIDCLTADVDPRNAPCLRLLDTCGFYETGREEATFVVDGRPCDSVYMRLDLRSSGAGAR
jgi:RimJ/RimL family protein N-acetyltransferase